MNARRALVALILAALVSAGGAAPARGAARAVASPSRLPAFSSCPALVTYARRNARRVRGGRGVPTRATPLVSTPLPMPVAIGPPGGVRGIPAPATADGGAAEGGFSGTNVQEAGVDEPDVVKSDGRRILAVSDGVLRSVDVTAGLPRVAGSLALEGFGHQLLLRGNRLLVLAGVEDDGPSGATLLTEVDVTDPTAMAVRRTLRLDGTLVDARQTEGSARVVVASAPQAVPVPRLRLAGARTWVPRTVLRSRVSGRTFRRSVVACDDVRHPRAFSGLDLVSVLTVDLDRGLYSVDRDAVLAGAETVYASPTGLYIASRRYAPDGGDVRTELHAFDTSRPDATAYRGSGSVDGFVLGQYALSEHAGVLRVATTSRPIEDGGSSESAVTVLDERDGALRRIGAVGGLGRGERIVGVRFLGDKGYVVTFRQTDPLYVLDLSDPTNPRRTGELKILGYSAYLHPVTNDLLLGVGQDATEEGATRGAQLSLFDVSDPAAPRRVAQATLGEDSSFAAEFDPHAFLYWHPATLAALPLVRYDPVRDRPFAGLVGFRVGRDSLTEAGRAEHPERDGGQPTIGRSLVIGERLYTVSASGVGEHRLDTLAGTAFAAFP